MSLLSLEWWQIALLFLSALLNLWDIWHVFNHTFETSLEWVLWMVACVFVPVLGGMVYVLFGWWCAHRLELSPQRAYLYYSNPSFQGNTMKKPYIFPLLLGSLALAGCVNDQTDAMQMRLNQQE